MASRNIIEINEELCDGCGQCIIDCAEGALEIIDGKAKLVGDIFCDGLGACLSGCPTGALKVISRDAVEFDEAAVERHLSEVKAQPETPPVPMACGCPGSAHQSLQPAPAQAQAAPTDRASTLGHWPIKLQLLGPQAPFIKDADLVLLADCAGAAYPRLHDDLLPGKVIALACPKLDDAQAHIDKLAEVLAGAKPKSLKVVIMEVPCCLGLKYIAQKALEKAGMDLPVESVIITRDGRVQEDNQPMGLPIA